MTVSTHVSLFYLLGLAEAMHVHAAFADGELLPVAVDMQADWTLRCCVEGGNEGKAPELQLQAVLPCSGELLYLFCPDDDVGFGVAGPMPPLAAELLVYAPVVPLVKCPQGFQGLSRRSWEDMTSASALQDSVMQVSAGDSLALVGDDAELDDLEASDDLEDVEEDDELSEAIAGDEEDDLEDSDEGVGASDEDDVGA